MNFRFHRQRDQVARLELVASKQQRTADRADARPRTEHAM
jgi:hypothetical protein